MQKPVLRAAAVVLAFAVALALGEAALRLTGRPSAPVIGWTGGPPHETNQFGFRGHAFDRSADMRVALLGDSQVEASATPFSEMPEVHLNRAIATALHASVNVVSIGSQGWGQDQELLALQNYIGAIHPSVVVLWFTEGNDLWNNTFPTNFPKDGWPKPTFWLAEGKLEGPNLPWDQSYRPRGLYIVQALCRLRGVPIYPTDAEWEDRLPSPYRPMAAPSGTRPLVRELAERAGVAINEVPYFAAEDFETEKTHYSIYLVPESPRLEYAAALTHALLLKIARLCQANGAQFFVLTTERWRISHIPEPATTFEVNGKGYVLSSTAGRRLIDGVLDGLPAIRISGVPDEAVISKTDSHWNVEGNRYVMEQLSHELVSRVSSSREANNIREFSAPR